MKIRGFLLLLIFILAIGIVNAQEISVSSEVITEGVHPGEEVTFRLSIANLNSLEDKFTISAEKTIGIFSEVVEEISFEPSLIPIEIPAGQIELIDVTLRLKENLDASKDYAIDIKVQSIDKSIKEIHRLVISLKSFDEVVGIKLKTPEEISPGKDNLITLELKNRGASFLEDLEVKLDGQFFTTSKKIDVAQFRTEELDFTVRLDSNTEVGHYNLKVEIFDNEESLISDEDFTYTVVPNADIKEIVTTERSLFGKTDTITKTNEGNSKVGTFYRINKGGFEKIFTSANPKPTEIIKENSVYVYQWLFDLEPGESFTVNVKTSYLPLVVIILAIILLIIILYYWLNTGILVTKKVEIKDKEVTISLIVRNNLKVGMKKVRLMDHLPKVIHPKDYGTVKPDEIHGTTTGIRLVWNINHIAQGEERIFSYRLDHKVDLIGKVSLPSATVIYNHKDKETKSYSNKVSVEKKE